MFAFVLSGMVYDISLNVFAGDECSRFSALQSRVHEVWARLFASSMKDDLRYTPSDCFATFPFPPGFETDAALEAAGQTYHNHRAALMIANNEGLTKTYKRFHNPTDDAPEIVKLRELHNAMDRAVLAAYGWTDLAARAVPEHLTPETEDADAAVFLGERRNGFTTGAEIAVDGGLLAQILPYD